MAAAGKVRGGGKVQFPQLFRGFLCILQDVDALHIFIIYLGRSVLHLADTGQRRPIIPQGNKLLRPGIQGQIRDTEPFVQFVQKFRRLVQVPFFNAGYRLFNPFIIIPDAACGCSLFGSQAQNQAHRQGQHGRTS